MNRKTFHISIPFLFFIGMLILFLCIKIQNVSIALSDTNEYYYFGQSLLHGKLLYKDILHADLPLFPYICTFYFLLTGGNLLGFYFTPTVEILAISILIFILVKKETKAFLPAIFSSSIFLFSGFVSQLSDVQEGIFTSLLFATLGYFFYKQQKLILSGIFLGLALSTKIYMLPVVIALTITALQQLGVNKSKKLIFSYIGITIVVLLPFLLTEFSSVYRGIFAYSLHRPAATDKLVLFGALVYFNFFLMIVGCFSLWTIKKHLFTAIVFIGTIISTLFFPDLHYLYFAAMIPFLSILSYKLIPPLSHSFSLDKNVLYITGILLYVTLGIATYYATFAQFEKVAFIPDLIALVQKEKPHFVYGLDQLVPAVSYMSGVPLLDGIIDTNENMFRKGVIDKVLETKHAVAQKTLVISYGLYYPNQHTHIIVSPDIVDVPVFLKSCTLLKEYPVKGQGMINIIAVSKCY